MTGNPPSELNKQGDDWGVGLDYLFEEIWPNLDQIRKDNENYAHDEANIELCFSVMRNVLSQKAPQEIRSSGWGTKDQAEVLQKIADVLSYYKDAKTINDKVIAINVTEQLLRTIY